MKNKNTHKVEGLKLVKLIDMIDKKLIIENNVVTGIEPMTWEEIKQRDVISSIEKAMSQIDNYDSYNGNEERHNPHDDVWDLLHQAKIQFINNIHENKKNKT